MAAEFDRNATVRQVTETLAKKFPHEPEDRIALLVGVEVDELSSRPVRDYVAVLAERAVRQQLRASLAAA